MGPVLTQDLAAQPCEPKIWTHKLIFFASDIQKMKNYYINVSK